MKKRALRKDFYMEIRRSLGRFLSIFFIVAIGCAFFSGIRASEPDMRYSGDAYFDNTEEGAPHNSVDVTLMMEDGRIYMLTFYKDGTLRSLLYLE